MQKLLVVVSLLFVLGLGAKAQQTEVFSSYKEMVADAKADVELISIDDFHKTYTEALGIGGTNFTLIDIRTESEYNEGFIPGAFLVQRGVLESRLEKDEVWEAFNHQKPEKTDIIFLYCRSGSRSALAAKSLQNLGYTTIKSLEGGWSAWNEKYPNLKKSVY